jgi:hypothetical protein
MSVEIREYREFKRKHPSRRTIPLFRILLVLVIVGALYHYDVFIRFILNCFLPFFCKNFGDSPCGELECLV